MALFSNYYCDGDSGSDTTGDGTSGSPFATLQKCIDTVDTESSSDLVTADIGVITIHLVAGDCGTNEIITGITDDATNYIRVLGLTHATKLQWDTSLPFINASGGGNGLRNTGNYTRIEHVQILVANTDATVGISMSGTNSLVNACIIRGPDDATVNNLYGIRSTPSSGTINVRNTAVFGLESSLGYNRAFATTTAGGTTNFHNCGAFGDQTTSGYIYGFHGSSGTCNVTNCYAKGDGNYVSVDTLLTSAAHEGSGTSANLDNIALTTTNFIDPVNATSTSRDFTLVGSTALSDGSESSDLSGTFTTDWLDNTIAVWPIGPIEFISGTTDPVPPLRRRLMMRTAA